jgi:iron complex transport system substrate-binding protein
MAKHQTVWGAALAGVLALASACGGAAVDPGEAARTTAPEEGVTLPVTVTDATGREVTVTSTERIVPVDGDLTEVVFALGLGENVVAADLSATYPPEVDSVPKIGYQRALSTEPIAAMEPTVVLATDLAQPTETLDQLRDLGVTVVVIDRSPTLDGPATKIRAVAEALGVPDRGERLATATQAEITDAADAGAQVADRPRVLVLYLRGEQVQLVMAEGSGVEALLPAVGAVDVAAELGVANATQVTAEAMLRAAPDALVVTAGGLESVGGIDGLLAIPGIAETPAGASRRIHAYDAQLLLGGGPRTGELMQQLIADLHAP